MRVKALKGFYDREKHVNRFPGEVFDCSQARYEALIKSRYGVLVEIVPPKKKKAEAEDA